MWRNISDNIIFTLKKYFAKPGYIYEKKRFHSFQKKISVMFLLSKFH